MRAALCRAYGGPEVVRIEEVPTPTPGPHDVLVRVHAASVSAADWRIRAMATPPGFTLPMRLVFGWNRPRQPVLGSELSGVITAVGREVAGWRVGDEVIAFPGVKLGAHAEFACFPATTPMVKKPDALSFEQAGAMCFGGSTALHYLRDAARLQPGERVLVLGAAGSVGLAAIQVAKNLGAHVTACARADALALLQALGADVALDREAHPPSSLGAFDVVVDTVGVLSNAQGLALLNPGGRLLLLSAGLWQMLGALKPVGQGRRIIAGPAKESQTLIQTLAAWAAEGRFIPHISHVFPLEQIAEAHKRVEYRTKRGNIVVVAGA